MDFSNHSKGITSVKVHHQPGGASNFSLSHDPEPIGQASRGGNQYQQNHYQQPQQQQRQYKNYKESPSKDDRFNRGGYMPMAAPNVDETYHQKTGKTN